MVEDAETAKEVVAATRYPLQLSDGHNAIHGVRGCATPFVRASGYGRNPDYMTQCQNDILVMVQVETEKGVEAIPEIASVPGMCVSKLSLASLFVSLSPLISTSVSKLTVVLLLVLSSLYYPLEC